MSQRKLVVRSRCRRKESCSGTARIPRTWRGTAGRGETQPLPSASLRPHHQHARLDQGLSIGLARVPVPGSTRRIVLPGALPGWTSLSRSSGPRPPGSSGRLHRARAVAGDRRIHEGDADPQERAKVSICRSDWVPMLARGCRAQPVRAPSFPDLFQGRGSATMTTQDCVAATAAAGVSQRRPSATRAHRRARAVPCTDQPARSRLRHRPPMVPSPRNATSPPYARPPPSIHSAAVTVTLPGRPRAGSRPPSPGLPPCAGRGCPAPVERGDFLPSTPVMMSPA